MKTSKSKTLLVSLATPIFASMTREELRIVARALGVPRGKNGKDTLANLQTAVAEGKAHVKTLGYVYAPSPLTDAPAGTRGPCIFIKKLRTYKGDKTLFAPADFAPQNVS